MWKNCCCQKQCSIARTTAFYATDAMRYFWASIHALKIVHGFDALYRATPSRRRWLTKRMTYRRFEAGRDNTALSVTVTFDRLNGAVTLTIGDHFGSHWPSLPGGSIGPRTVRQSNSLGFLVFAEGDFDREDRNNTYRFRASETHAELYTESKSGPSAFNETWTLDLSDPYDDALVIEDVKQLTDYVDWKVSDFGFAGTGLAGIPIMASDPSKPLEGSANNFNVRYNDCPLNGAILIPPLFTPAILTGGLDAETHWPNPAVVKTRNMAALMRLPLPAFLTDSGPLTWEFPLEAFSGQRVSDSEGLGPWWPVIEINWVKIQLAGECRKFCKLTQTVEGPLNGGAPLGGGSRVVLETQCDAAQKLPWVRWAGWPAGLGVGGLIYIPFRNNAAQSAPARFSSSTAPDFIIELKPRFSFPKYDDDPYHIWIETVGLAPQTVEYLGEVCACDNNPLP